MKEYGDADGLKCVSSIIEKEDELSPWIEAWDC